MRIALGHVDEYDDTVAAFAHQLGLTGVQLHAPSSLPGEQGFWTVEELRALRERCTADDLVIEGLENVPTAHFWKVQRGLPGRDEQIENYQRTIRNMAATGYDLLGYTFSPTAVWRTDMAVRGRGGALVTAFDLAEVGGGNALAAYKLSFAAPVGEPLGADKMWANHQYFLDAVLPVAEQAGVRLSLHPDDPPVDVPLDRVTRIFTSPAAIARGAEQAGGSPSWGLTLCVGTISSMAGQDGVDEVIDAHVPAGRVPVVHLRDVQGTVPAFTECFLGEGNVSVVGVLRHLYEAGFDGFVIDDHVPSMVGDGDTWRDTSPGAYCSRGRANSIGYLRGILDTISAPA